MISENAEWAKAPVDGINSERPIFRTFYKKQYDLYHVKTSDFFFVVNPVLNLTATDEKGGAKNPLILNTHGFEARGRITSKIGFYTYLTDNQENPPAFISNYSGFRKALPGIDYYLNDNASLGGVKNYDYFNASGYIDISALKDHVNITFGNGKNFIGDGIRSLFLSDNSANSNYLKINTRIWKFN